MLSLSGYHRASQSQKNSSSVRQWGTMGVFQLVAASYPTFKEMLSLLKSVIMNIFKESHSGSYPQAIMIRVLKLCKDH